jgi:hypothetical protein
MFSSQRPESPYVPISFLYDRYGALSPLVKGLGCEGDYPPSSSAKIRIHGAIPPFVFMAWCLIKHKDNFTFIFVYIKEQSTELKQKKIWGGGGRKTKETSKNIMEQTKVKEKIKLIQV